MTYSVSIHAPRVGRDTRRPRVPMWDWVSIHAPRVGRDTVAAHFGVVHLRFNPRAPRGARPSLA